MSETVSTAAGELRRAGDLLGEVVVELRALDLALPAGPGRLGDVGLELGRQWVVAADARVGEALGHSRRLVALARALDEAVAGYGQIDDGARRRHEGVA